MPAEKFANSVRKCHAGRDSPDSTSSMDIDSSPESCGNRARQRLRPWLEAKINSGQFPGLAWVDRDQGIFRITWKHGGRADWSEQDALIFKEWAIHTGRYREGMDQPDWPSWKTRLRCALNKLPDIQELKDQSCYDEPNPYRVYRFVDRKGSSGSSPTHRQQTPSPDDIYHNNHNIYNQNMRPSVIHTTDGRANIPTIITDVDADQRCPKHDVVQGVAGGEEAPGNSLGSLGTIPIQDLIPLDNSHSLANISVDSNINSCEPMETDPMVEEAAYRQGMVGTRHGSFIKIEPTECELVLTLRFRQIIVQQRSITNLRGCRIYYGHVPDIWAEECFGDPAADQWPVPYSTGMFESPQEIFTKQLMDAMERGFNIYTDDRRNIYVHRRCKTSLFTAPPNQQEKSTIKVGRQIPVKIFDFENDFYPAYQHYQQGCGPRPSAHVVLAVGQNFRADCEPYNDLLFSVTVCHVMAQNLLAQAAQECEQVEISRSDQFDDCASFLTSPVPQIIPPSQNIPVPQTTHIQLYASGTEN